MPSPADTGRCPGRARRRHSCGRVEPITTLHLHGAEAHASFLTQRAHRAAYCDFLVRVTPENQREALRLYGENETEFSGLRVEGAVDLSFLTRHPRLRYLEVVSATGIDTSALSGLENLRGLRIEQPKAGIDFR